MHQHIFSDEDEEEDTTCNVVTSKDEAILRIPTKEEIDEITTNMVSQAQTRGILQNTKGNIAFGVFFKKNDPKKA